MNIFAHFHILREEVPGFAPDFYDPKYGEYGYREWYDYYVFYAKDIKSEMSYDSMCFKLIVRPMPDLTAPTDHHARVSLIHLKNDISISKVTHAGRCYAAQTARAHGATVNGTKALGGWNESGAFRNCYDRAFPVDALLSAAGFNARRPEQYCLPRSAIGKISCCILLVFLIDADRTESLEPPTELLQQIFPWVESELAALNARAQDNRCSKDIALRQFLKLLLWLRTVLLQDGAVLYSLYPHSRLYSYRPFNTKLFREFAARSVAIVEHAESEARFAYEKRREQEENVCCLQALGEQYTKVEGLLSQLLAAQPSQRGHKGMSYHITIQMFI
jgi:hypothetical protein